MRDEPLYERLDDYVPARRLALTIGVFDGVHLGHQALVRKTLEVAKAEPALQPAALTLDPHPAALFAPRTAPLLLGTLEERAALLRAAGATRVIVAPFNADFAALTPEEFVISILSRKLRAGAVIVGSDFQYGRDRGGDVETLARTGVAFGFSTHALAPVSIHGIQARSTIIRQFLAGGAVDTAARLLGRDYSLGGTVVSGRQLGRTLGFPTANLDSAPGILVPGAGVYAGRATLGTETFRAAISVGDNPTVAPEGIALPRTVEAFLLDGFDRDIYGETMTLSFASRLRAMEKYDGLDALIAQMHRDVDEAKRRLR